MTVFTESWGGGDGPVSRLPPAARLLGGLLVCACCIVTPLTGWRDAALVAALLALWLPLCGLPTQRLAAAAAFAAALFLPMLLLALPLRAEGRAWPVALAVPTRIILRSTACVMASAATMSTLRIYDMGAALAGLRLPHGLQSLLLQIVHQTALLAHETQRMTKALKVRGFTASATGLRLRGLCALPQMWLLRLLNKAERVGDAMEVRGFGAEVQDVDVAPPPACDAALSFDLVSVRYRPDLPESLANVSFTVKPGERIALLGLNGSGKTTLLSAAAGLTPFTGRIIVCGMELTAGTERAVRDRIGFLFGIPDDQLLFPNVLDDVSFSLERMQVDRSEARQRARGMLERLGVGAYADCSPHQLSQGQRQRVALAGALAAHPSLLLLDEPSSALDHRGKDELAALLKMTDSAIILATHDLVFAQRVCRRFILLDAGRIVADSDNPETLINPPPEPLPADMPAPGFASCIAKRKSPHQR